MKFLAVLLISAAHCPVRTRAQAVKNGRLGRLADSLELNFQKPANRSRLTHAPSIDTTGEVTGRIEMLTDFARAAYEDGDA